MGADAIITADATIITADAGTIGITVGAVETVSERRATAITAAVAVSVILATPKI